MSENKKIYVCRDCSSTNVLGTAWVNLNTDVVTDIEPPTYDLWCEDCGDETKVDLVNLDQI
jgi:hypothetical protein